MTGRHMDWKLHTRNNNRGLGIVALTLAALVAGALALLVVIW